MEADKSESETLATKPTLQDSPESAVKNDTSCSSNADVALEVEAPEKMTEADNTATRDSPSSMDSPGDVDKSLDEAAINTLAASDESGRLDGSSQKVAADIAKHGNQDDNMIKNKGESEVSTVGETSEGQLNPTPSGNSVSVDNGPQKPIKSETEDDIGIDCHKIAQHFDKSDNPTDSTGVHTTGPEPVLEETVDNQAEDGELEAAPIAEAADGDADKASTNDATLSPKGMDESVAQKTSVETELFDSRSEATTAIDPTASQNLAIDSSTPSEIETTEHQALKIPGAPKPRHCQIVPIVTRNPDYAAEIKGLAYDKEEALTKLIEDIDRSERDGDLGELCAACDKKGSNVCNRCKHARYCSRECQVADWPIHKKVCPDFAGAASDDKRPSPEHHRILFCPTYSTKPELRWAVHRETENNEWLEFEHPDFDRFMEKAHIQDLAKHKGHTTLNLMHTLGTRRIGHMLTAITYTVVKPLRNTMDPKLLNQSINGLSKPGYMRPWFGPVSFYADARHPGESVPPKTRDITPRDVNSIVRLLECCDCVCVADPARYHEEVISGLRINDPKTDLNIAMGITGVFDSTKVPLSPVYSPDYVITMAFHLGLCWYIRPGNFVGLRSGMTVWNDGNLRYLAYVCTLREVRTPPVGADLPLFEPVFNYGPFAGSVVVLHGSGNPVHPQHVVAFNAYLDEVCVTKGVASRTGFEQFWAEYKAKMGGPLASVPSPYKWEKKGVKDRMGVFHPDLVMRNIAEHINDVWMAIITEMGKSHLQTFPDRPISMRRR